MDIEADTGIYFLSLLLMEVSSTDIWYYAMNAVVLFILLLLSGMVSGSELAMFSLSQETIDECRESESSIDRLIAKRHSKPQLLLATILIFNNFLNVTFIIYSNFARLVYLSD